MEGHQSGSGEVRRARLPVRGLSVDDEGCEGRSAGTGQGQAGGDLEEAAEWKVEMHCGYLQFGSAGADGCRSAEVADGSPCAKLYGRIETYKRVHKGS